MVIKIQDDIANFLKERTHQMQVRFGKNSQISCVDDYVNILLDKWMIKTRNKEAAEGSNKSLSWESFKGAHSNEIYIRDKGRCVYCTERVPRKKATLDHRVPVKRGGANTLDNVCTSCRWCNEDKGVLTDEEYYYKQLHNAARGITPNQD